MGRAIRLALLTSTILIATLRPAAADCGLNAYPPFSGYGFDSDQCKVAWQIQDWNKVIVACASDARDAAAERQDFTGLTVAAQSWAKVAIAYDKIGQTELSGQARSKALSEIRSAIEGFESEKPTPDDDSAQSASTLQAAVAAPNFYSSTGCAP
jgi:hypothetical protein